MRPKKSWTIWEYYIIYPDNQNFPPIYCDSIIICLYDCFLAKACQPCVWRLNLYEYRLFGLRGWYINLHLIQVFFTLKLHFVQFKISGGLALISWMCIYFWFLSTVYDLNKNLKYVRRLMHKNCTEMFGSDTISLERHNLKSCADGKGR